MNSFVSIFGKVRNKLMLSFLAVALLPALFVGIYAQNHTEETLMNEKVVSHENNIATHSLQIKNFLQTAQGDIKFLSRSFPLERYLEAVALKDSVSMIEAKKALEQEFLEFADSRNDYYSKIRYLDEHGKETVRIDLQGASHLVKARTSLLDKGATAYFKNSVKAKPGSVYVSTMSLDRKNGKVQDPPKPVIKYAMPVQYPNGRPAGSVVLDVAIAPMLRSLGDMLLISDEGYFFNHRDFENEWGAAKDLGHEVKAQEMLPAVWEEMLVSEEGSFSHTGQDNLFSFKKLTIPGSSHAWWLAEESMAAELFAEVDAFRAVFFIVIVGALLVAMFVGAWASKTITKPLAKLTDTVRLVSSGEQDVRAQIQSGDEFQVLGDAFDQMVDERIATMARMEVENEALNNSIIELMEATAKLSEYDLSISVPVREDITGVVADGLNKMIKGTNKILDEIREVSENVAEASQVVKERSDAVSQVAEEERQAVEETLTSLDRSAKAMQGVAELATTCTHAAETAIGTTETALQTVTGTVDGMNEIRSTISETEKRIKRLGERSQEINSVVEIINNIAERTHVLALNASMQAAAAGEAGRGFAVVADEVQRLAENSRNSTSQIAALVHNIQAETAETMATMNRAISQVVSGSELAEQAGRQMEETQVNTRDLVESVLKISQEAVAQAEATNNLRKDAAAIRISTQVTGEQLQEQGVQTDYLVNYAQSLRESVDIFKLKTEANS